MGIVDLFGNSGSIRIDVNQDAIDLGVKNIEQMMTTNPELRTKLQAAIREDVQKARAAVVNNMPTVFDNGDPNEARRAVRRVLYQQILGANLNIYNMKRGTAGWKVRQVERKVEMNPRMRGGNRRSRSFKTIRMYGYEGKARGMILRWLNDGVNDRTINFASNSKRKVDKWNKHPNTGNRGSIAPRNFFGQLAGSALSVVSQHLAMMIEEEIANQFNNNNQ